MTGKERINRAMRHQPTDRVPLFTQFALGHYMLQSSLKPYELWHSPNIFTDALILLADRYGCDGILINLPGRPKDWKEHIEKTEQNDGQTIIHWREGGRTVCPENDNAHYFGDSLIPPVEEIDPDKLYYVDPHDITGYKYPFYYGFSPEEQSESTGFFPGFVFDSFLQAHKKAGSYLHISSEVFSPFTQFMEYFGYEKALMALADNPDFCKVLLGRLARGAADMAGMYADLGADSVLVSSAFAGGGFISRDYYKEFVLPYEKLICNSIHTKPDCMVYVHTCGAIGDRIHLMVEAGYDGVDTMDPPPLGNTDIAAVKQQFGSDLFLKGNVDPVNVILNGTPDAVYENAVQLIKSVGVNGGYILSSACSIAPAAPPENILALSRACRENPF